MADRRVNSRMLLVGSLPAQSPEHAFRAGAELFGDMVFSLPDGETGPMAGWVSFEREHVIRPSADIVVVSETDSPTGLPRHAYETPVFTVRRDVERVRFETWPRIDAAIESYGLFRELKRAGVIGGDLRFQVGLPFPSSAMNAFKSDFAADYPKAEAGYEDLVARELPRLLDAIPPEELAIQWDCAYETQDIERVLAWTNEGAWERFAGPVTRLTRLIPEQTLVGYHLCYGTFPEWPMYEARDYRCWCGWPTSPCPNPAARSTGCTWPARATCAARTEASSAHWSTSSLATLASSSGSCFRSTARRGCAVGTGPPPRYLQDFGVAMYCGFGRQPGQDGDETMREHAQVIRSLE